jgi:hypothetical protein
MVTNGDLSLEEDARHTMTKHLAQGKGMLPQERHNEQAEKRLTEELTARARAGEHFPSSLPGHREQSDS